MPQPPSNFFMAAKTMTGRTRRHLQLWQRVTFLQVEELWSQEVGQILLLIFLSALTLVGHRYGYSCGRTRHYRVTRAPALLLEDQKGEPQRIRAHQGDPREERALESNPLKIFMNSQVHFWAIYVYLTLKIPKTLRTELWGIDHNANPMDHKVGQTETYPNTTAKPLKVELTLKLHPTEGWLILLAWIQLG